MQLTSNLNILCLICCFCWPCRTIQSVMITKKWNFPLKKKKTTTKG